MHILIFIYISSWSAGWSFAITPEFNTLAACEDAKSAILKSVNLKNRESDVMAKCVPKGSQP